MAGEIEVAMLTATFDAGAGSEAELAGVLARYVVLTRNVDACRNVDLVMSATQGGRFLVIEKWDSAAAVQAHLDSDAHDGHGREVLPLLATQARDRPLRHHSAHDLA